MRGNYIKKWHAQARNVIKRTFGILKNQFAIMKTATQYYYKDQVSIVITCHVMHNLILMHGGCDSYDDDVINENDNEDNVEATESSDEGANADAILNFGNHQPLMFYTQRERDEWHLFRDSIAKKLWNDYCSNMNRQ